MAGELESWLSPKRRQERPEVLTSIRLCERKKPTTDA